MKIVEKKILPRFYKGIVSQKKTFELRRDEDDIQVGDIIHLREWDGEKYTGHQCKREVTYVLRDCAEYGLMDGYCIYGLQPRGWNNITMSQNGNGCMQIGCVETYIEKR